MSTDKKLAEGHIFTTQPDGVMRQDYLFRVSIKAVIYNDDGELLVVKEHGLNWGLPGGGLDFGETFEQALARELEEEVGYRCMLSVGFSRRIMIFLSALTAKICGLLIRMSLTCLTIARQNTQNIFTSVCRSGWRGIVRVVLD